MLQNKTFQYVSLLLFTAMVVSTILLTELTMNDSMRNISKKLNCVSVENKHLKTENLLLKQELANITRRNGESKTRFESFKFKAERNKKINVMKQRKELEVKTKAIEELERKIMELKSSKKEKRTSYEILRRRINNQLKEMWFYLSAQITKLNKMVPNTTKAAFTKLLEYFGELHRIIERDFEQLVTIDGAQRIRDGSAEKLSVLVQKRLQKLQNPLNCNATRKLVCSINRSCGFACQMHSLIYCFMMAYATKRTAILRADRLAYRWKGWNAYFKPLSENCAGYTTGVKWDANHNKYLVVQSSDILNPTPATAPPAVPREFYNELRSFHGYPFVWWIGQFTKYLFQLQPSRKSEISQRKDKLNFRRPIVGVHIRRTDKVPREAQSHTIHEYMNWVGLYYKKLALTQKVDKKRVFIATDDASVVAEARQRYPGYIFLSDTDVSKSAGMKSRSSEESLRGIISDIELLSDSDYLVCTFSSGVCRLAYEKMNSKHTDASQKFHSLDDIYYLIGQQEHRMKVLWSHVARDNSELNLAVGDTMKIHGNHWDGQALALHHASNKTGLFPAYKAEDIDIVADFPVYTDD